MSDRVVSMPNSPKQRTKPVIAPTDPTSGEPLRWETLAPDDFDGWTKSERVMYACRLVVFDDWTRAHAAKAVGVTYEAVRRRLNGRGGKPGIEAELLAEKAAMGDVEEEEDTQLREEDSWSDGTWGGILTQERRVGTPWGFQKHYFGHITCPDCNMQHPQPDFHREILKAWHHPDTRRLLTNIPPYHAKTTVFSIWDTVYDLAANPNSRTIVVSKTQAFASSILFGIQQWLTDESLYRPDANLIKDFGPFRPNETGFWSKDQIFVQGRNTADQHPSVLAVGVGQQIYGRRADKIKSDDIATLENQRTLHRVETLMEWIDKELLSRIGKNGKAGFMGTRVGPGDIYGIMARRANYRLIKYPAILDHQMQRMLWGDHFDFKDAEVRMAEMSDADWQMVYQQVEIAASGLSFDSDSVDKAKDESRTTGEYDSSWLIVGGIDLAGSRKTSGHTVLHVEGVDRTTGKRYAIDAIREKSMTPDRLRAAIFQLSNTYPLVEWRVEANAMQEQIVQMNSEISRPLASQGVRIVPHQTQGNKWDKDFGVESQIPLLQNDMYSIPWRTDRDRHVWGQLVEEMLTFPIGHLSDHLMAKWFAELAIRSWLQRDTMPVFQQKPVPDWVAKRRRIYRPREGTMERIPVQQQSRMKRQGGVITQDNLPPGANPDEW